MTLDCLSNLTISRDLFLNVAVKVNELYKLRDNEVQTNLKLPQQENFFVIMPAFRT